MTAELASRGNDPWAARGLEPIGPGIAFPALERLLKDETVHGAVMAVDWSRFLSRLPAGLDQKFFAAVTSAPSKPGRPGADSASFLQQLRGLTASERRPTLLQHLLKSAHAALGETKPLDPSSPLREAGLDSLMAVELRNMLSRSLGQQLPATLLFDYPSLDALANHLARRLGLDSNEGVGDRTNGPPDPTDSGFARLSDEEAELLLLAELNHPASRSKP